MAVTAGGLPGGLDQFGRPVYALCSGRFPQSGDAFLNPIRHSPEFIRFLAEMKAENDRYRHEFS
jgi:hypothetical protein